MSGHARSSRRPVLPVVCLLVAVVAACSSSAEGSPPVRTGEPPTERIPIIIDADFDLSDLAAIAILLRDPAVDVRAITIAGTGIVRCDAGRRLARYLIDELGPPDIPFGCGREDGGSDAHPLPDAWRARAAEAFGLDIPPSAGADPPRDAVDVIAEAVETSPSAPTVVALGPLTNLEDAFAADETLADRLAGVHAMLGAVDVPGNVFVDSNDGDDRLEWNAYADPSAVDALFSTDVPVSIVPLDATDDAPVPSDLADTLETDHQAGGADLVHELLVRNPQRLRPEDGQQLWDELAALALTDPDLVGWQDVSLTVGPDGRLTRDDAGRNVRFAAWAERAAVETALLEGLRRGEPRTTPFVLTGALAVTFDGVTCSISGTSDQPGVHQLTFQGPTGLPSGTSVTGVRAPHTWAEAIASLRTVDAQATPPDWIVQGPTATDPDGTGALVSSTGTLEEDLAGVVCFTGEWPQPGFVAGGSFPVGSGAIRPT